jgi:predicted RNA-binding protein with PIN domain
MTTFVVDGYNALFRLETRVPEDRDLSRDLLLRRVRAALRAQGSGDRVEVVLDARGGARAGMEGREAAVSWTYVRGSADEAILRRVSEGEPAETVVVTDDRELRGRARQRGSRVLSLEAFFGEEPAGPEPEPPPAPGGAPLSARDFGLPEGPIDLSGPDRPRL